MSGLARATGDVLTCNARSRQKRPLRRNRPAAIPNTGWEHCSMALSPPCARIRVRHARRHSRRISALPTATSISLRPVPSRSASSTAVHSLPPADSVCILPARLSDLRLCPFKAAAFVDIVIGGTRCLIASSSLRTSLAPVPETAASEVISALPDRFALLDEIPANRATHGCSIVASKSDSPSGSRPACGCAGSELHGVRMAIPEHENVNQEYARHPTRPIGL
jgi:hypothetical protein